MGKKYKEWEGKEFTSADGYKYTILGYISKQMMEVMFEDGTTMKISKVSAMNQTLRRTPKKAYGIGISDYSENSLPEIKEKWRGILRRSVQYERGYSSKKNQKVISSYDGVSVCEEWLTFSNFEKWMLAQTWQGNDLDKDLFGDGKLYSPETCCFLPHQLNIAIQSKSNNTGVLGVSSEGGYYKVCTYWKEKRETCVKFKHKSEAHKYWQENKIKSLTRMANEYYFSGEISDKIRDKILSICTDIQDDIDNKRFTVSIV